MRKLWTIPLVVSLAAAAPATARAFCGFYVGGADTKLFNNATMVVLMRDGMRTVLSMQNNYEGPPENFALVVPVPVVLQKENVKTLPREVFAHIDQLAAPRLVEYWEQDPCAQRDMAESKLKGGAGRAAPSPAAATAAADLGVKIEAQFTVGEYEILILSAEDSTGLDTWLRQSGYKIPEGAEPVLKPYVAQGMKFFVAKVDVTKVKMEHGQAMLSPLRFHYDSDAFSLPVRLGLLNSNGTQDLVVHILARNKRYEVANYGNVMIPTNYDIDESAKDQFGAFYAALFDKTIEKNPGSVVTEYSWDAASCDPCPGPALNPQDIVTLGADALPQPEVPPPPTDPKLAASVTVDDVATGVKGATKIVTDATTRFSNCYNVVLRQSPNPKGTIKIELNVNDTGRVADVTTTPSKDLPPYLAQCVNGTARSLYFPGASKGKVTTTLHFDLHTPRDGEQAWYKPPPPQFNAWGFTLTRLHARYGKEALGKDLVFREASGVVGGREDFGSTEQKHGSQPASTNNFQGRYIIRHPWTGPVACQNPRRGVWGGPPGGALPQPKAALDTAFAPRGKIELASFFHEPVPELSILPNKPSTSAGPTGSQSCGACSTGSAPDGLIPCSFAALLALLANERRKRRR